VNHSESITIQKEASTDYVSIPEKVQGAVISILEETPIYSSSDRCCITRDEVTTATAASIAFEA
jgi:hypothetical protein